MATQADQLIQDQNFHVHYTGASSVGGKTNALKAERKGGNGGRKPLSDLSNSGKPALNQAPKIKTSKKVQAGSRKALLDISNSGKAHLREEAPKKNLNKKLGVVAEEPLCEVSAVAEEKFLHNHQECIKAHTKSMDMDEFLRTVGLNSDLSKHAATPSVSGKIKPENSLNKYRLELEEMTEELIEDGGSSWKNEVFFSSKPNSPPLPCMTPKSPSYSTLWKDCDIINFKLMETPKLPRH